MIIIQGGDPLAIAAAIAPILQDHPDATVLQSEDEVSTEVILNIIAFNLTKLRQYVGRLERNTGQIGSGLTSLGRTLEPVSTLASVMLEDTGLSTGELQQIKTSQQKRAMSERLDHMIDGVRKKT